LEVGTSWKGNGDFFGKRVYELVTCMVCNPYLFCSFPRGTSARISKTP
jgi:hypothetical protein